MSCGAVHPFDDLYGLLQRHFSNSEAAQELRGHPLDDLYDYVTWPVRPSRPVRPVRVYKSLRKNKIFDEKHTFPLDFEQ